MMQNLLQHIEDNQKAGGEFTISAFTKPVYRQIGHLEGGGGKIKFKIYPKSQDIKWAANTDVFSGSVWDASEKVSKDKKSELLGVSYTKYPSLQNVNEVKPNLASIIERLAYHHNELGIALTGSNFRLEYDENIPYSTKKLLIVLTLYLTKKYGKLVKPEVRTEAAKEVYNIYNEREKIQSFDTNEEAEQWLEDNNDDIIENGLQLNIVKEKEKGIQPTQTNETLKENINSVRDKIIADYTNTKDLNTGNSLVFKDDGFENNKIGDIVAYKNNSYEIIGEEKESVEFPAQWLIKPIQKEYTEKAIINTKIAKLKEGS